MLTPYKSETKPILVEPREASRLLSISPRTLWQLTKERQLPTVRIGRCVRYRVSVTKQAGGLREVQFIGPDAKRRTIRLGHIDQKTADSIRLRVEEMNVACIHGTSISSATAQWLHEVGEKLHKRLVRAGLCQPRVSRGLRSTSPGVRM